MFDIQREELMWGDRKLVLETGKVVLTNDSAALRHDPEVQKAYLGT